LGFDVIKRHPSDPLEDYLTNLINPFSFFFLYHAPQSGTTFSLIIDSPFLYEISEKVVLEQTDGLPKL